MYNCILVDIHIFMYVCILVLESLNNLGCVVHDMVGHDSEGKKILDIPLYIKNFHRGNRKSISINKQ